MSDLFLIGIGTGNPDHLTFQGAAAIRGADLILIPRKGPDKADLADLRRQIISTVAGADHVPVAEFDVPVRNTEGDYLPGVSDWHDAIAVVWAGTIAAQHPQPRRVALLIWGDPSLYDSSLRIASRLDPAPRVTVIPGITALQALTAAHGIPLTTLGAPVLITTGRRLAEAGWPACAETVAVMLDGKCAFLGLPGGDFDIWWGGYLGMEEEVLVAGPLDEVADEIVRTRAAARAIRGWIMDSYLLHRRSPDEGN